MQPPDSDKFTMDLGIEDVYLLYDCVCKRLQTWEGAPQRHAFEQEHLWYLRDELYKCVLHHKFHEM
jgi:hypothetical protein